MVSIPSHTPRMRRAYDLRLREHVVRSGARSLARHVPIPRSTVSTWQRRGLRPVVTIQAPRIYATIHRLAASGNDLRLESPKGLRLRRPGLLRLTASRAPDSCRAPGQ